MNEVTFQYANRFSRLNRSLQVVLACTFILGVNLLSIQFFARGDLGSANQTRLAPETVSWLEKVDQPIRIFVTLVPNPGTPEEELLYNRLRNLLDTFTFTSREVSQFPVKVEYIDIYKNLERASVLSQKYQVNEPDSIIVASETRARTLRVEDLISIDETRRTRFSGESQIASAIAEVVTDQGPKIYFTTGHGEARFRDTHPVSGFSEFARELELRNFTLAMVDLTKGEDIPADADLVIVANPQGALSATSRELLRRYLDEDAGSLLLWAQPGIDHGLNNLLVEWAIGMPLEIIIERDRSARDAAGKLLIRNYSEHPVTQPLIELQTPLLSGNARPVLPLRHDQRNDRLSAIPLFATSERSWSESTSIQLENPQFDPGEDFEGPVPVAVCAERKSFSDLGINVPGGRVVALGSGNLFTNETVHLLGNRKVFFETIEWLVRREDFLNLPAPSLELFQLPISNDQLTRIALLFSVVPLGVLVMGSAIVFFRRL